MGWEWEGIWLCETSILAPNRRRSRNREREGVECISSLMPRCPSVSDRVNGTSLSSRLLAYSRRSRRYINPSLQSSRTLMQTNRLPPHVSFP